ncbi:extracellular solute-binding protein family 3 [Arcobacter nitrofigilis DSM 7299]|uniref:Extracellular solute-binding protein family 3 n=1 Tax=Arcobacter nitrofigilis (strain ATCC 33309 / DSM 7299 / CCUG 15893 / LMG 7604 / NCTC 12251 / CI) TaxID=572480 RepID=D5V768_ARCNC|nr:transporter substrate-binding domain-containing protein [Arcobacter nitrofigilis]ADG94488.1 extracellular solute-binding protein family 3 [Arcobacter nitrofigilis DSM 7299]
MKKLLFAILSSLLVFILAGCGENEKEQKSEKKVLKVGMELAYPPFEMSDKDGNPSGVSVDFAKALGKYLGRDVVIENIAWDGLIPSLKTGKIDLIISSMTITDERKKSIDFSIPYAQSSLAILANKDSGIKSIDDLNVKGKTVAVKKGSTGHIYAKEHLPNANVLVFDKEAACVLEVVQGKADGFIYDQLTIYKNYAKHMDTTVPLLQPFQKDFEYWGVALKKGSPLKADVDAFIKKAKEDGTFDKLANKYLSDAKKTFDKLNIPFFF